MVLGKALLLGRRLAKSLIEHPPRPSCESFFLDASTSAPVLHMPVETSLRQIRLAVTFFIVRADPLQRVLISMSRACAACADTHCGVRPVTHQSRHARRYPCLSIKWLIRFIAVAQMAHFL
jgi:hypothetical protein